eukprot:2075136-Karenia_brevis.AAC.1
MKQLGITSNQGVQDAGQENWACAECGVEHHNHKLKKCRACKALRVSPPVPAVHHRPKAGGHLQQPANVSSLSVSSSVASPPPAAPDSLLKPPFTLPSLIHPKPKIAPLLSNKHLTNLLAQSG